MKTLQPPTNTGKESSKPGACQERLQRAAEENRGFPMPNDDADMKALEMLALGLYWERSDFLQTLVDLRKEQKFTQGEVPERMGATPSTVSEFERYDATSWFETIICYPLAVEA